MKICLGLLVLLAAVWSTPAGARVPRATYYLEFETNSTTSCSRSSATSRHRGSLRLKIEREAATLSLSDVFYHSIGPGRGGYRRGRRVGRKTSRYRVHRQYTWSSRPHYAGGSSLQIALTLKSAKCTALPLYGKGPGRSVPCRRRPAITLACRMMTIKALRRAPKGGYAGIKGKKERARAVSALRCSSSKLPLLLRHTLHEKAILLTRKPALKLYSRVGYLGSRGLARPAVLRR